MAKTIDNKIDKIKKGVKKAIATFLLPVFLLGASGCATVPYKSAILQDSNKAFKTMENPKIRGDKIFFLAQGSMIYGITPYNDIYSMSKDGEGLKNLTLSENIDESDIGLTSEGGIVYKALYLGGEQKFYKMNEDGTDRQEIGEDLYKALNKEK